MKEHYGLIDCGEKRKLEKFGNFIIDRPAPAAEFNKKLKQDVWEKADYFFDKNSGWRQCTTNFNLINKNDLEFKWGNIKLKLTLTDNGQIGVFPEHFHNWKTIISLTKQTNNDISILNGFAYTGAATIAASLNHTNEKKITVCHVDSSKPVIKKAKENANLSKVASNPIRWIQDDIISFMEKEIKRENFYNGIILDPPAFGRGKGKKVWKLKNHLPYLIELSDKLISKKNPLFFILSCHDKEIGINNLQKLISRITFTKKGILTKKHLIIPSKHGNPLPAGITVKWTASLK
jgi:23S rRNA (cytosine1962-C5)-methyltransferase